MKKYLKIFLFGFVAWLIPFAAAFLFYTKEGKLTIDMLLFKEIMLVVGSITAAILLVAYFKKISANYMIEGIRVGFVWFGVNILLDLLILIPMSGMSVANYFTQIGLGYLLIPIMCIMVGKVLADKNN